MWSGTSRALAICGAGRAEPWEPRGVPARRKVVSGTYGARPAGSGRRTSATPASAVLALLVASALAGCAGSESGTGPEPDGPAPAPVPAASGRAAPVATAPAHEDDQSGGMGVPQLSAPDASDAPDAPDAPHRPRPLTVRLQVSDRGCFLGTVPGTSDPLLVVWPEGTAIGASGDEYVLPSGATATDGSRLSARGALMPVRSLPSYAEDGYWAMAVDFCTPDAARVLFLTEVRVR